MRAMSSKIRGMRAPRKSRKTAHSNGVSAFFSVGFARLAVSMICATLASMSAYAADTDSISPSTLGVIEKNLRDFGQKARDTAAEITSTALGLVGVDYKFGGNHPDQGLDCSGFVRYVFQHATGISLPRSSKEQAKVGQTIDKAQLQPGDLVFFNTRRFQFSHVGVYLGDNKFIHSPSRGGSVEVVDFENRYWQKAFNGARRIVGAVAGRDANATTMRETTKIDAAVRELKNKPQAALENQNTSAAPSSTQPASPFTRDY
jgi:cell wall-associated NlpC family hydrolase